MTLSLQRNDIKNYAVCSFFPGGKLLPKLWLRERWHKASRQRGPPACFGPQFLVRISVTLFSIMFTCSFPYCMGVSGGVCSVFFRPGNDFQMSNGSPGVSSTNWLGSKFNSQKSRLSVNICVSHRCLYSKETFFPLQCDLARSDSIFPDHEQAVSSCFHIPTETSLTCCWCVGDRECFVFQWIQLTCGQTTIVTLRYFF